MLFEQNHGQHAGFFFFSFSLSLFFNKVYITTKKQIYAYVNIWILCSLCEFDYLIWRKLN